MSSPPTRRTGSRPAAASSTGRCGPCRTRSAATSSSACSQCWPAKFGNRRTMTVAWVVSLALVIGYAKRVDFTSFVVGPYADRDLVIFLFIFLTGTLVAAWASRINLFGWLPLAALVLAVLVGRSTSFWSEPITQASLALLLAADRSAHHTCRSIAARGRPVVRALPLRLAGAATRGDVRVGRRDRRRSSSYPPCWHWPAPRRVGSWSSTPRWLGSADDERARRRNRRRCDTTSARPTARPIHTEALPATPTRDRNIVATAWLEAPPELLQLGADLPDHPEAEYKRRIGDWLLWRAGPAAGGDARYWAGRADDLTAAAHLSPVSGQHRRRHRAERSTAHADSEHGRKIYWADRRAGRSIETNGDHGSRHVAGGPRHARGESRRQADAGDARRTAPHRLVEQRPLGRRPVRADRTVCCG